MVHIVITIDYTSLNTHLREIFRILQPATYIRCDLLEKLEFQIVNKMALALLDV